MGTWYNHPHILARGQPQRDPVRHSFIVGHRLPASAFRTGWAGAPGVRGGCLRLWGGGLPLVGPCPKQHRYRASQFHHSSVECLCLSAGMGGGAGGAGRVPGVAGRRSPARRSVLRTCHRPDTQSTAGESRETPSQWTLLTDRQRQASSRYRVSITVPGTFNLYLYP